MSFYRQPLNEFLSRTILFLFIATVVLCIYQGYEIQVLLKPQIDDNNSPIIERLHSFDSSEVESAVHRRKKIFIAFFYWEQLTMATNNLLHLSALAAQGGRQVVVPFVKDSFFRGAPQSQRKRQNHKFGLYYDVTALNESLRLHGYGTLINWEGFQDVCKGKLDVLVYFHYKNLTNSTSNNLSTSYDPCKLNQKHVFLGIKIGRKICVNAHVFDSVQRFEDEIVEKLPCVGIMRWRGTSKTEPFRTHFNIESLVDKVLSYLDMSAFFSAKLLRIAQDFIAQHLISNFISVHVRTEQILVSGGNISTVKRCLFKLRKRLQSINQLATVKNPPVFLAADFTKFGSSSATVKPARKHAKSFMKILLPLRPIVFQPSEYKIVDRGAAAIVEMNILASGRHLFVLGDIHRGLRSPHSITERLQSTHACEAESSVYRRQKLFLAFYYWEQLTMATNNFLNLTALAAQGGRQVVVPFVKDSHFRGVPTSQRRNQTHNTLALYYNVSALNETLHLHGYGTLITWEGFQDVCKGKVDVLVCFYYTKLTSSTTNLSTSCAPCKLNNKNVLLGIEIGRRICVNANSLNSVQIFESEVVKNLPCVGIREWRGITTTITAKRTHFDIESKLDKVLTSQDMSVFFSVKLLRVARDFIAQKLTSNFISVHIRTEKILSAGGNISAIKRCLFNLRKRLQNTIQVAIVPPPIFLATDFTAFGSSSEKAIRARKYAKSFIEILLPLRPIVFRPPEYKIVDGGAVAIVEMNILASGRRLFVLGGGSFQLWITNQFLTKNNNDRSKVERIVC